MTSKGCILLLSTPAVPTMLYSSVTDFLSQMLWVYLHSQSLEPFIPCPQEA